MVRSVLTVEQTAMFIKNWCEAEEELNDIVVLPETITLNIKEEGIQTRGYEYDFILNEFVLDVLGGMAELTLEQRQELILAWLGEDNDFSGTEHISLEEDRQGGFNVRIDGMLTDFIPEDTIYELLLLRPENTFPGDPMHDPVAQAMYTAAAKFLKNFEYQLYFGEVFETPAGREVFEKCVGYIASALGTWHGYYEAHKVETAGYIEDHKDKKPSSTSGEEYAKELMAELQSNHLKNMEARYSGTISGRFRSNPPAPFGLLYGQYSVAQAANLMRGHTPEQKIDPIFYQVDIAAAERRIAEKMAKAYDAKEANNHPGALALKEADIRVILNLGFIDAVQEIRPDHGVVLGALNRGLEDLKHQAWLSGYTIDIADGVIYFYKN